jgi:hypothetical protein
MVAARDIPIDPESDAGQLLNEAADHPVIARIGEKRYRVITEVIPDEIEDDERRAKRDALFANYDPKKALAALEGLRGLYGDMDIVEFKREIREARGQFTASKPYDFPEILPLGSAYPFDTDDPFESYDPEKALTAMRGIFGMLKDVDIEALKAELDAERGHIDDEIE